MRSHNHQGEINPSNFSEHEPSQFFDQPLLQVLQSVIELQESHPLIHLAHDPFPTETKAGEQDKQS